MNTMRGAALLLVLWLITLLAALVGAFALTARIEKKSVRVLPVFSLLRALGELEERPMFNTFNMGVGMTLTVPAAEADRAAALLGEDLPATVP